MKRSSLRSIAQGMSATPEGMTSGFRRMGLRRNPHPHVRGVGSVHRRESRNGSFSRDRQPPALSPVLRRLRSPVPAPAFVAIRSTSFEVELPTACAVRRPSAPTAPKSVRRVPVGTARPWMVSSGPKSDRPCPQSTSGFRSDIPASTASSRRDSVGSTAWCPSVRIVAQGDVSTAGARFRRSFDPRGLTSCSLETQSRQGTVPSGTGTIIGRSCTLVNRMQPSGSPHSIHTPIHIGSA